MRATYCLLIVICLVSTVRGDIIIDDFDDTASAGGGVVEQVASAVTENVGPFAFQRTISVGVLAGDVVGEVDANVSTQSHLTLTLDEIIPTTSPSPIVATGLSYFTGLPNTVDLSDGGKNNALFLDFKSLDGPPPPGFIRLWLFDDVPGNSFAHFISPVPTSSEPFTLAVPFSEFQSRGGAPIFASFTRVYELLIDFQINGYIGSPEDVSWQVVLDRVRVGAVPEPGSSVMFGGSLLLLMSLARVG